jgi:hypothetical protein
MPRTWLAFPALVLSALAGCAETRMISWNGTEGVVALPRDTNCFPTYERDAANRLMAEKCPGGFKIIDEKEVVVNQQTVTSSTGPEKPAQLVSIKLLGGGSETTQTVTTSVNQTEYHIRFRATAPAP